VRPLVSGILSLLGQAWSCVPSGGSLPETVWRGRRRFLVGLTWFHAVAIAASGPVLGHRWEWSFAALFADGTVLHAAAEGGIVAVFAAVAGWPRASRTFQATCVGFGLMSASGILVHLSGGYIEAHFHFFVMLAFLALCQDWIPYLLAVAFVAVHHGVVGVIWPEHVYNHTAAYSAPWTWAGIHAGFVLASCIGSVIAWRFNERAFAQTSQILKAAGEGIFGVDMERRISFINPAGAAIFGVDARQLVGTPVARVLPSVKADGTPIAEADCPLWKPLADGRLRRATDHAFARMDGSYFPVDYTSTPMIERDRVTGLVVSFQDITERRRAAAALEQSHHRLEATLAELQATQRQMLQQERLRTVGQMASGIAHDFNNTLSPILGFSELLLRAPHTPGADVDNFLRLINTAARDAAAVVRRLSHLYRERDETSTYGPVNFVRCIEEAVALTQPRWRNEAQANGITIRLTTDIPDRLPSVTGDESEIREMLVNLVVNAIDAMPEGGTITLRAHADAAGVHVAIRDTGAGMSEEVRQRCLQPFFSTKGQHGSGLGLSLVHAIVERHGGTVDIESEPGRGTTIRTRFPISTAERYATRDATVEEPSRRLRVLLVEDQVSVRKTVAEQLTGDGHVVDDASNGLEALEKFVAQRFDLVITDRAMPEMGGDELAGTIARLAPDTPIVMLTGFGDLMDARGEKPPGVTVLVSKPITLPGLRKALAQATSHAADPSSLR
jgi:PAS domain S-box-containing protein